MSDWKTPGRGQEDALDRALASLYQAEPPESFDIGWRAAVRWEENIQMKTVTKPRRGPRLWKMAMPAFAALVLVAGTLMTGAGLLEEAPQADHPQTLAQPGGTSSRMMAYQEMSVENESIDMLEAGDGSMYGMAAEPNMAGEGGLSVLPPMDGTAATQEKKIVRTADMTLTTATFDVDSQALRQMAEDVGGYVENVYQYGDEEAHQRHVTFGLRIPTEKLDGFLGGAAGIGRLTARSESATDMTVQYTDTALRLKTQRDKMTRLQELLGQAQNVADLLQIETEIANTQYQLDSYETSLRGIDRQVNESAVTVTLVEETASESAANQGISLGNRLQSAWQASLKGIGTFFRNMLVFLTMALPVLLPLGAIGLVGWLAARKRKVRKNASQTEQHKED